MSSHSRTPHTRECAAVLFSVCIGLVGSARGAAPSPVDQREAAQWLRWLIPLPKEIEIPEKVHLSVGEVCVRCRQGAGDVETTAAGQLETLLAKQPDTGTASARFEILLGVSESDGSIGDVHLPEAARRLSTLSNREQAYAIRPVGKARLVVIALGECGVYHGVQTLRQLLEGRLAEGKVTIPLAKVTDWPDLARRGLWGGNATSEIAWMASYKLNHIDVQVRLGMTDDGRGSTRTEPVEGPKSEGGLDIISYGRLHAMHLVPVITHLGHLRRTGLYDKHPDIAGKGPTARRPDYSSWVAPCANHPRFAEILADWMISLAAHPHVDEICAWLSEEGVRCGCDACRAAGQYVMETRALLKAYQLARKRRPDLRLRILLTQGSYWTNDRVLAEIPDGVGVDYYHGSKTYDSSRAPMIYPLLAAYAAQGRWLGCYPQLTPSWGIVCPWSAPQFIKARMTEFVDKGLTCLCGYATPSNRLWDFNITATAEWSWNARGRDERAFALAWATRRKIHPPELAAEWAVMLGPVGWDVYGSNIPNLLAWDEGAKLVKSRIRPVLGLGMFRYFPTVERFDKDLAVCDRAMTLARRLKVPEFVAETQVIRGYIRYLKVLYRIAEAISGTGPLSADQRTELQAWLEQLTDASLDATDALRRWERLIGEGIGEGRFVGTLNCTEDTTVAVAKVLASLGVKNPAAAYLPTEAGRWSDADFRSSEWITKRWDVTPLLREPGRYQVRFRRPREAHRLRISRVALASAPATGEPLTVLSEDRHDGTAQDRSRTSTYSLRLANRDPTTHYVIVADLQGTRPSSTRPEQCHCEGSLLLKRVGTISQSRPF